MNERGVGAPPALAATSSDVAARTVAMAGPTLGDLPLLLQRGQCDGGPDLKRGMGAPPAPAAASSGVAASSQEIERKSFQFRSGLNLGASSDYPKSKK